MSNGPGYPVHERLDVLDAVDVYRTDEWWKAALKYSIGDSEPAVAIYLWWNNNDGDWVRKQKYNIESADAWLMDRQLVATYLPEDSVKTRRDFEVPVSDYYRVAGGETVFKTDEWWKAVVVIDRKGDWDTHEVIIYLWQYADEKWRRRQKFAIKSSSHWADDRLAVEELLDIPLDEPEMSPDLPSTHGDGSLIIAMAKELGIDVEGKDLSTLYEELETTHLSDSMND